jgi:pimeloyl-ACP methyl ester carboxylesterase
MIRVYLGHGASGTAVSMRPWVDGLRRRGIEAHALELPKRKAEDAVAAYEAQVPDEPGAVVGGHSFGGRVASLAVAGVRVAGSAPRVHPYAGLVCLSYPLHAPGRQEAVEARSAHWPSIEVPALLLSGTSDPFARIDLLEAAMPKLPDGRLVTYPKLGHGLLPVRDDVLDRIAAFVAGLDAA